MHQVSILKALGSFYLQLAPSGSHISVGRAHLAASLMTYFFLPLKDKVHICLPLCHYPVFTHVHDTKTFQHTADGIRFAQNSVNYHRLGYYDYYKILY